ncbi:hypothetical protein AMAG_12040 [Allomyces macrogynus ATCC 38327]|uniref:Uncharacterized protein n=1 Tax=Allomyces macrogynus (strain ATCC 38327) TaxID=578462 RepID=A0A0L0SZ54_ALLM3|nr:hypothetical protein AMAG_12040 [Allomyces macrogynus ATCC 38327]|eukprot:KNE67589.1 hypothetical protein AMAG_12040 [Allomyces macrogynus ATCC 38327]
MPELSTFVILGAVTALIVGAAWLALFLGKQWLATRHQLLVGRIGFLRLAQIVWTPKPTSLTPRVTAQTTVTLQSFVLHVHWDALRAVNRATGARVAAPKPRLFSIHVTGLDVAVHLVESATPSVAANIPRAPAAARLRRNRSLFHRFFGSQIQELVLQLVVYVLVRWVDLWIADVSVHTIFDPAADTACPPCRLRYYQSHAHLSGLSSKELLATASMMPPAPGLESESDLGGINDLRSDTQTDLGTSYSAGNDDPPGTVAVVATFSAATLTVGEKLVLSMADTSSIKACFALPSADDMHLTCRSVLIDLPQLVFDTVPLETIERVVTAMTATTALDPSPTGAPGGATPMIIRTTGLAHPPPPRTVAPRRASPTNSRSSDSGKPTTSAAVRSLVPKQVTLQIQRIQVYHDPYGIDLTDLAISIDSPDLRQLAQLASQADGSLSARFLNLSVLKNRTPVARHDAFFLDARLDLPADDGEPALLSVNSESRGIHVNVEHALMLECLRRPAAAAKLARAASTDRRSTTPVIPHAALALSNSAAAAAGSPALDRKSSRFRSPKRLSSTAWDTMRSPGAAGNPNDPLVPPALRRFLRMTRVQAQHAVVRASLVVHVLPTATVNASVQDVAVAASVAGWPSVQGETSVTVGAVTVRVKAAEGAGAIAADVVAVDVDGIQVEGAVSVVAGGDGAPLPPLDANLDARVDTDVFAAATVVCQVDAQVQRPVFTIAASPALATTILGVMDLAQRFTMATPPPPTARASVSSPIISPMTASSNTGISAAIGAMSSPIRVLADDTATYPGPAAAAPMTHRVDLTVDSCAVGYSQKRPACGARGAFDAAVRSPAPATAMPASATTAEAAAGRTMRVEEVVIDCDGVRVARYGAGPAMPSEPVLIAPHVVIEHKAHTWQVLAAQDTLPSLHHAASTSVQLDEHVDVWFAIPMHQCAMTVLRHLRPVMDHTRARTPPADRAAAARRVSITSLTTKTAASATADVHAVGATVTLVLPDQVRIVVRMPDIHATVRSDEGAGMRMPAASVTVQKIEVLATKSRTTLAQQKCAQYATFSVPELSAQDALFSLGAMHRVECTLAPPSVGMAPGAAGSAGCLTVAAKELALQVPYGYCLKDVIENMGVFVKLVKPPKSRTGGDDEDEFDMPVRVMLDQVAFTVEDDPFEAKLGQIFRNGKDLQRSRLERERELAKTLAEAPGIDQGPFWAALHTFHAAEWTRVMASAAESAVHLISLRMEAVDIYLTPPSLMSPTLATTCHLIDKATPSVAEFDFALARDVSMRFRSLGVHIRDYPLPLASLPASDRAGTHHMLHGLVILAEPIAPPASTCVLAVPVDNFGETLTLHVAKAMAPIKCYATMSLDLESPMSYHWGPAVEPALADLSRVVDEFTEPSLDPSEPIPWWDKIRWLVHGKLRIEAPAIHVHVLGSRNPYYNRLAGDGSDGVVVSSRSNVKLTVSSATAATWTCDELEVAIVQPRVTPASLRPSSAMVAAGGGGNDRTHDAWGTQHAQHDRDVVMSLQGNVAVSLEPIFECLRPAASHHDVYLVAPEHVPPASAEQHDSFLHFRSLSMAIVASIQCDSASPTRPGTAGTTGDAASPGGTPTFHTFTFSPRVEKYVADLVEFNVQNKPVAMRRGALFPLSTPKYSAKKFSLFLSRVALRVTLAPLLVTIWHQERAILNPDDAIGLRAVVGRGSIDFHCARFRSHDTHLSPPPWYIDTSDVDFADVEIRSVVLTTRPSTLVGNSQYTAYEANETVQVRFANHFLAMGVQSMPFFWTPKLAYSRKSDVDYGRESSFGRDINKVQLQLLHEYLAHAALDRQGRRIVEYRISQLESNDLFHVDQDDYVHSFVIHNSRLLWDEDVRNNVFKLVDLHQRSSLLSFYLSTTSLRILRELENLVREQEQQQQQQQFQQHQQQHLAESQEALHLARILQPAMQRSFIRSISQEQLAMADEERWQPILTKLLGNDGNASATDLTAAAGGTLNRRASMASGFSPAEEVVKFLMIQFLNPQIKLCTPKADDAPDGSCFVTTENTMVTQHDVLVNGALVKTVTHAEISDANFSISAMQESALALGLAAPYLAPACALWIPLEFILTPGANVLSPKLDPADAGGWNGGGGTPSSSTVSAADHRLPPGFKRVISRASTRVHHQKLNPAISAKPWEADLGLTEEQDTWQLELTDFVIATDALAYSVLMGVIAKLLIYRDPTRSQHQEKLETILLAVQADDVRVLMASITALRQEIMDLRLALHYDVVILESGHPDVDGTSRWGEILARVTEIQDHLLVVMDAFKIIYRSQSRQERARGAVGASAGMRSAGASSDRLNQQPSTALGGANAHPIYQTTIKAGDVVWYMLQSETQAPFLQLRLSHVLFTLLDFTDQSRKFQLLIDRVTGRNLLPNPVFENVVDVFHDVATSNNVVLPPVIDVGMQKMVRVYWHELAPVAGIALVEHFEVNLAPLKFSMTYELGRRIVNFIFPLRAKSSTATANNAGSNLGSANASSEAAAGLASTTSSSGGSGGSGAARSDVVETASIMSSAARRKRPRDMSRSTSTDALHQMKSRASQNRTFVYIKMPSVALCISYRGNKEKNIEDINDFVLTMPTLEYRNRTWTWLEFLTQVKKDVFFAVLGHTGQLLRAKVFPSRSTSTTPQPVLTAIVSASSPTMTISVMPAVTESLPLSTDPDDTTSVYTDMSATTSTLRLSPNFVSRSPGVSREDLQAGSSSSQGASPRGSPKSSRPRLLGNLLGLRRNEPKQVPPVDPDEVKRRLLFGLQ